MCAQSAKARTAIGIAIAGAVLAAGALAAYSLLRPVALVEPVVADTAVDAKPASITVTPEYGMELKSEVGGRVLAKDFHLDPGAQVKAGDVLARIDPAELELAIEKDQNDFAVAKERYETDHSSELRLESAHGDLENYRRLTKLGSYSEADLAKREREVKTMEQQAALEKIEHRQTLANFDNALKVEHLKLDHMAIAAPFDGIVSEVTAHPGDLIGSGSPVATLITTHKVVVGKVSEEDFAKVRVGEKASVTFIPYGVWIFPGTIIKILPTADPETQRHIVHLEVEMDKDHPLVPGINGEASIVVDQHPAHAIVPRRALFTHAGDVVWVVRDGRVSERKVKKGFVWATGVEILEGLEPGEQVIVDELEQFREGQRVGVKVLPSDALRTRK